MKKQRLLVTLLVSVLLHAGVVALLRARPAPKPAEARPTELLLFEVSLPPPPVSPPAPTPAPTPTRPVRRATAPAIAQAPAPAPAPAPEPPAPSPTDAPFDDAPRMPARVTPSLTLALSLDAGTHLEEEPGGLRAPSISSDLVGELAREAIGRGKVDRGLVHPYYSKLGKALIKNWDADRAVSSAGLKGFVEQMGENTKVWTGIWQEKAEVFGKSGSPFDAPVNQRGKPVNDRLIPGQDLAARKEVQKAMAEQFRSTRRAQIRVTQDATGKLVKVELLKPSNDSNVDQQALADVRAAAESLPPPPAEALGSRATLVSIWEFELVVSITPPVPTFSFEFDEVLGFVDARLPLDRRIYKKVRLVSVE